MEAYIHMYIYMWCLATGVGVSVSIFRVAWAGVAAEP